MANMEKPAVEETGFNAKAEAAAKSKNLQESGTMLPKVRAETNRKRNVMHHGDMPKMGGNPG